MPSNNVRVAYLKRNLQRLDREHERIRDLASVEQWSQEQLELVIKMIERDRVTLIKELEALEPGR
jgi:hypothetical protein